MANDDEQSKDEQIARLNYLLNQTIEEKIEDRLYHLYMESKEISHQLNQLLNAVVENNKEDKYNADLKNISFLLERSANLNRTSIHSIEILATISFIALVVQGLILWKLW